MQTSLENFNISERIQIPPESDKGKLGISYLKRIWSSSKAGRDGVANSSYTKYPYVMATFDALGIGLEPTFNFLYNEDPSFDEFEDWIFKNGLVNEDLIEMFNTALLQVLQPSTDNQATAIFDERDLAQWRRDGYIILKGAVTKEDSAVTAALIHDHLGMDSNDPTTWYSNHPKKQGIMIQLFRHPQLHKNRMSSKILRAYQQLWGRTDLIVSTDRVSFNPPETDTYPFQGPHLHWDISLKRPIPFGLQGLLYLSDTPANQGAFSVVPGFHKKINDWLEALPESAAPREQDLNALDVKPIAAEAGDMIIWHQALPHGSSPNKGVLPRIVQYINYQPLDREIQEEWI